MTSIADLIEDTTRRLVEENGLESGIGFPTGMILISECLQSMLTVYQACRGTRAPRITHQILGTPTVRASYYFCNHSS